MFYANPYDIAPYSRGVLTFEIPYSALAEFIDESFMPVEYEGDNGMLLADDGDKLDRSSLNILGTVTVDEDGQSVVLSAEETVYNVKIYTSGRMLWQRNYLTTGEGVEVKSFIPDAQPNIAVSYELADGNGDSPRHIPERQRRLDTARRSSLLVDLQDAIQSGSLVRADKRRAGRRLLRRRHTVERLAKIRGGLIDLGLDAVLITDELNQRYAAGFAFTDGAVLVTLDRAFLLTDSRYIEAAEKAFRAI